MITTVELRKMAQLINCARAIQVRIPRHPREHGVKE